MTDMSAVIVPKSDQINADDLIAGPRTVKIVGVSVRPGEEQPVSISIEGDRRVYRPCKTMSRVLVAAWGADSKAYVGRSMTLYHDPSVKWGGMEVGGIRISHLSDIDREMTFALTETRVKKKVTHIKPLKVGPQINGEALRATAMSFASKGRDAFVAHFNALSAEEREAIRPFMAEFKAEAERVNTETPDPFAADPDPRPTAEDMAAAEAAALEAARAQEGGEA